MSVFASAAFAASTGCAAEVYATAPVEPSAVVYAGVAPVNVEAQLHSP